MECELCRHDMIPGELKTESNKLITIECDTKQYYSVYICPNCGLMKVNMHEYAEK